MDSGVVVVAKGRAALPSIAAPGAAAENTARAGRTLVQATLDGTLPPMPFNQIQCADLKGWDGRAATPGWRKLLTSLAELTGSGAEANPRTSSRAVSVCVLPFQNMSGDAEQEYFSDGISEDITTDEHLGGF